MKGFLELFGLLQKSDVNNLYLYIFLERRSKVHSLRIFYYVGEELTKSVPMGIDNWELIN